MLEKLDKQIDAVIISTPDHTHYPAAMMAIEMGKHVFVQKPMAHTVWEVRQLMAAAKRNNVVTQMGIQGHSFDGTRRLKEWVGAGTSYCTFRHSSSFFSSLILDAYSGLP